MSASSDKFKLIKTRILARLVASFIADIKSEAFGKELDIGYLL